ncbi:MAG TPA: HAMP domain-containing sensor histidine kinase [Actinomycetales bacterium]|nr:HAMP domain-containing sensor histidine kinase [Actinomycetales bacterium]
MPTLRRLSVRTRVVTSMLAMTALGMAVSVATLHVVRARELDRSASLAIEQEVEEFRAVAEAGVDGETGEPFTTVEQLLRVALQHNVPGEYQTFLTVLGGRPLQFDGGDRPVRLEKEKSVLDAVTQVGRGSTVSVRDVETSAGTVRLGIVPVSMPPEEGGSGASQHGTYVIGVAVGDQRAGLIALTGTHAMVALGALLLVGLVGWAVTTRLLSPLAALRSASRRITEQDLGVRIPEGGGSDDVSELTRAYNAMLDRLEAGFSAQRQLLDDAGHELLTPLTILRGHLELLDTTSPTEVAETRALVLDELDRMSRLVDDLLMLAKAQRPDFVQQKAVPLDALVKDVADKARALGDRCWKIRDTPAATVLADPQRLTQALLQLTHNAVRYSDTGTCVELGCEVDEADVRLWVRDEGHGIRADDMERIFERFGRAASGRGIEGSGLGLPIVAAIASAHAGRVELESTEGCGSTFTIVLPRKEPVG